MPTTIAYAYDLDGTNPLNRIPNEVQFVVPPTSLTDTSVVVPRCAPFHGDTLVVNTGSIANPVPLTAGVDYFLVYKFIRGSRSTGHQMFGGIMFTNRNFNGNIWLTYQTVGGDCVVDDYSVVEQWSRSLRNVRYISWDQLAGLPAGFPTAEHVVGGDTLVGLGDVADGLNAIAAAITDVNAQGGGTAPSAGLAQHIASLSAHTPAAVGLGNLQNWPVATTNDLNAGAVNAYVNAAGVKLYVSNAVGVVATEVDSQGDDIAALQSITNGLVSDVDTLQTQHTTMANTLDTHDDDIAALQDTQSDLITTVGAAQAQLDTTTSNTNDNTADIAALGARFKLHGLFCRGSFLFTLLPNEQKDFTIISPGGEGGRFVYSPFEFKLVETSHQTVILSRLSDTSNGSTLASPVDIACLFGAQGGRYGFNDGADNAGLGGQAGGIATFTTTEMEAGYTSTVGAAGTDGTTGDVAPVAGAAGYVIGGTTYGAGTDGDAKSGGGGSGAKATFTIKNSTTYQLWYHLHLDYCLVVGDTDQYGICKVVHHDAP